MKFLYNLQRPLFACSSSELIHLFATNAEVDEYNQRQMLLVPGEVFLTKLLTQVIVIN